MEMLSFSTFPLAGKGDRLRWMRVNPACGNTRPSRLPCSSRFPSSVMRARQSRARMTPSPRRGKVYTVLIHLPPCEKVLMARGAPLSRVRRGARRRSARAGAKGAKSPLPRQHTRRLRRQNDRHRQRTHRLRRRLFPQLPRMPVRRSAAKTRGCFPAFPPRGAPPLPPRGRAPTKRRLWRHNLPAPQRRPPARRAHRHAQHALPQPSKRHTLPQRSRRRARGTPCAPGGTPPKATARTPPPVPCFFCRNEISWLPSCLRPHCTTK